MKESAFYDALAKNGSAKQVMQSDTVGTQRESVRADLRRKAMYGYPPNLSEDATMLVLKQAELSTEAGG